MIKSYREEIDPCRCRLQYVLLSDRPMKLESMTTAFAETLTILRKKCTVSCVPGGQTLSSAILTLQHGTMTDRSHMPAVSQKNGRQPLNSVSPGTPELSKDPISLLPIFSEVSKRIETHP